ncbi:MAG: DUF378 domain-containing protein [Patescibacteria group bacterium]
MKTLHMAGWWLAVIGAVNWGLVGAGWLAGNADWNVVHMLLGGSAQVEAVVYVLVGLSGLWLILGKLGIMKK